MLNPFQNTDQLLYAEVLEGDIEIALQSDQDETMTIEMRTRVDDCFEFECVSCSAYSECANSEVANCNGGESVTCNIETEASQTDDAMPTTAYIIIYVVAGLVLLCTCFIVPSYFILRVPDSATKGESDDPKLINADDNKAGVGTSEGIWSPVDPITAKSGPVHFDFKAEENLKTDDGAAIEIPTTNGGEEKKVGTSLVGESGNADIVIGTPPLHTQPQLFQTETAYSKEDTNVSEKRTPTGHSPDVVIHEELEDQEKFDMMIESLSFD